MKRLLLLIALLALPTIGTANAVLEMDPPPACYPGCPPGPAALPVDVAPF